MVARLTGAAIQNGFRGHKNNSVIITAHQLHLLASSFWRRLGTNPAGFVVCGAAVYALRVAAVSWLEWAQDTAVPPQHLAFL
jgi:hypothetical protein